MIFVMNKILLSRFNLSLTSAQHKDDPSYAIISFVKFKLVYQTLLGNVALVCRCARILILIN